MSSFSFYLRLFVLGVFSFFPLWTHANPRAGTTYWDYWKSSFTPMQELRSDNEKSERVLYPLRYSRGEWARQNYLKNRSLWEYSPVEREKTTLFYQQNAPRANYVPRSSSSSSALYQNQNFSSYVTLTSRALSQRKPHQRIDDEVIDVFHLSLFHKNTSLQRNFVGAVLLDSLEFQLFSGTGIAQNPQDFELVINGEEGYAFSSQGNVKIHFQNARMASGDSLELEVGVRLRSPDQVPLRPGSFRLRLLGGTAYPETGSGEVGFSISGASVSQIMAYSPVLEAPSSSIFSLESTQIRGQRLSAGEQEYVLALNLEAYYEDMQIQEIILRDVLSRGDIDRFVQEIQAVWASTGQVLDTTRFVNGSARFTFKNKVTISRGGKREKILFRATIRDRVDPENNKFKLEIDPRDLKVYGVASGKILSEEFKNVRVESDIFEVVQSGGTMFVEPKTEQPQAVLPSDTPQQVYFFRVVNQDFHQISLARLSLQIRLNGFEYFHGGSIQDFELQQIYQGREVSAVTFTPVLRGGDSVSFDASRPIFIDRRSEAEFVLKLALKNESTPSSWDSVAVSVSDDLSSIEKGTLAQVRDQGAYFIWSDQSGRPHKEGSSDWLSGYLIQGLPTSFEIIRR